MSYGIVSSSGVPSSEMGDKPLDHAVILDTEDDIGTKLLITCSCGVDLEVSQIRVDPKHLLYLLSTLSRTAKTMVKIKVAL